MRSKNSTSSWGGSRHLPRAFTEEGIYMLMTVLKGDLAVKQSIDLVRTFKKIKDYILENCNLIGQREILQLSMETANKHLAPALSYIRPGRDVYFAVTCPLRYRPKKMPSSTYLSVSETHMGNLPVATAVCPFSIPVWNDRCLYCRSTSSIRV